MLASAIRKFQEQMSKLQSGRNRGKPRWFPWVRVETSGREYILYIYKVRQSSLLDEFFLFSRWSFKKRPFGMQVGALTMVPQIYFDYFFFFFFLLILTRPLQCPLHPSNQVLDRVSLAYKIFNCYR